MLGKDTKKLAEDSAQAARESSAERQVSIQSDVDAKREWAIAPDGGRPTTDMQAQVGKMMHGNDVRHRLTKLNANLRFFVANADPDRVGVYVVDHVSNLDDPNLTYRGLRFVCGMEKDFCPEFSVRVTRQETFWNQEKNADDTREVFAGEVRGWRTVLARLIRMGLISYPGVVREFGDTSNSQNWHTLVH